MKNRTALCLFLATTGCSVLEIPPPPGAIAVNRCDSEEAGACGSGDCENGVCVARGKGELTAVILEVTPPSGALNSGGIPFYLHVDELTGGDIEIETVVPVTGKVTMTVEQTCNFAGSTGDKVVREADDGTVPASVSFIPSERALGIGVAPYSATVPIASVEGQVSGVPAEHRFVADLPPGNYDVYVQPRPPGPLETNPECELLPVLVRNQRIEGDLEVKLPVAETLDLTIRLPIADAGLEGWTVDLLDPTSGRVLSFPKRLGAGAPSASGDANEYETTIRYSTPLLFGDDGTLVMNPLEGHEVVRLTPPQNPDITAPVFVRQRSGLGILGGRAVIDLTLTAGNVTRTMALPPPVTIQGQTSMFYGGAPVEAAVTLMATQIEGLDQFASFIRTVEAGTDGLFEVTVLPGRYLVRGFPRPDLDVGTADGTWDIGRSPTVQSAKTLEFPDRVDIEGRALVSGGSGTAYGASVRATTNPRAIEEDVLLVALGETIVAPLATSDLVTRDGNFSLRADPGKYDFFVQPEARSRYPWYVRSSTVVPATGRPLGDFHIPFPVIHRGRIVIKDSDTAVPDALIRVYAYVTSVGKYSPTPENFVVQVAEARADEDGGYELLIPASLDARQ